MELRILLAVSLLSATLSVAQKCAPAIQVDQQPQVFVMSDISNEPDDTMSFIRLLVHSDQYNITGMVAVTSYWQNSSVYPDQILNTTQAYGQVVKNLQIHSDGVFPTEQYLSSVIRSGPAVYGTAGIGVSPMSSGAQRLIEVVDGMADNALLHVQSWGGMNMLAETLAFIRSTRSEYDIHQFTSKLRIYSISDQDNAGAWIRYNFPHIPYICSIHAWNQYGLATWSGISGDTYYNFDQGGPDTSLVTQAYISKHFQIGPLGSHYPDIAYIMEGDSPSILHTMMNGLNGGPYDHPEYGGWGGRYNLVDLTRQAMLYSDSADNVIGMNNKTFTSNQASIWRWRQAYQDEMSARIQWTIRPSYSAGSHPPVVVVNASCGSVPISFDVDPAQTILLDASQSYDPDANLTSSSANRTTLQFAWFQYSEITATQSNVAAEVPKLNFTLSDNGMKAEITLPIAELACAAPTALKAAAGVQEVCQQYHVILEVTGSGSPPIRRYRRIILKVRPPVSATKAGAKRDEL